MYWVGLFLYSHGGQCRSGQSTSFISSNKGQYAYMTESLGDQPLSTYRRECDFEPARFELGPV